MSVRLNLNCLSVVNAHFQKCTFLSDEIVDGRNSGEVPDANKNSHDQLDNLEHILHPSLPSEDMDRMISQELEHIDNHTLEAVFKGVLNNEQGAVTSPKIGVSPFC